jgi:hypothetical protein
MGQGQEPVSDVDVVWVKNYVPLLGMLRILHRATGGYATYYRSTPLASMVVKLAIAVAAYAVNAIEFSAC